MIRRRVALPGVGTTGQALVKKSVGTLASNQATGANTTPVSLTGLSFSYAANSKYRIRFYFSS